MKNFLKKLFLPDYHEIPNYMGWLMSVGGVMLALNLVFRFWEGNKEYNKLVAEKEIGCQVSLNQGKIYADHSYGLRRLRSQNVASSKLKQPGINTEFRNDAGYVLIKTKPDYLIPPDPYNYDSPFFKSLSDVGKFPPQPLMVKSISMDASKKEALVSSECSRKPFKVPLENLYAIYQPEADTEDPLNLPNLLGVP